MTTFDAYVELTGADYATPRRFEDDYMGDFASEEDFARWWFQDWGDESEFLDLPARVSDLFSMDFFASPHDRGVYVFRNVTRLTAGLWLSFAPAAVAGHCAMRWRCAHVIQAAV